MNWSLLAITRVWISVLGTCKLDQGNIYTGGKWMFSRQLAVGYALKRKHKIFFIEPESNSTVG